jgi:hypothetical protein
MRKEEKKLTFFVFCPIAILLLVATPCHCPSSPLWPCPCFNPKNSHWQRGAVVVVVHHSSSSSFIFVVLLPLSLRSWLLFIIHHSPFHCSSLAASTCDPPHKQWLTGLGWVTSAGHSSLLLQYNSSTL